jgi:hypothetical protein
LAQPTLKVYDDEEHYLLFSRQEAVLRETGKFRTAAARAPRGGEFAMVTAAGNLKRLAVHVAHGPHAEGNRIYLDTDAAENDWLADSPPAWEEEFTPVWWSTEFWPVPCGP